MDSEVISMLKFGLVGLAALAGLCSAEASAKCLVKQPAVNEHSVALSSDGSGQFDEPQSLLSDGKVLLAIARDKEAEVTLRGIDFVDCDPRYKRLHAERLRARRDASGPGGKMEQGRAAQVRRNIGRGSAFAPAAQEFVDACEIAAFRSRFLDARFEESFGLLPAEVCELSTPKAKERA